MSINIFKLLEGKKVFTSIEDLLIEYPELTMSQIRKQSGLGHSILYDAKHKKPLTKRSAHRILEATFGVLDFRNLISDQK